MSADLHIHVIEPPADEEEVKRFLGGSLGSKYFDPRNLGTMRSLEIDRKISETPNVRVGEVSWLKAMVFEDNDAFIPTGIAGVYEIIGEDFPEIDDALIDKIRTALELEREDPHAHYEVSGPGPVVAFLEAHKGKRAFTVSW